MNVLRERWVSKRVNTTGQAFIDTSKVFLRNIRGWPGAEVEETGQAEAFTPAAICETFSQFPHGLYNSVAGYSDVGTWLASGHLLESPIGRIFLPAGCFRTGGTYGIVLISSSRNAIKHGLLTKELLITTGAGKENKAELEALIAGMRDSHKPVGMAEELLLQEIGYQRFRPDCRSLTIARRVLEPG